MGNVPEMLLEEHLLTLYALTREHAPAHSDDQRDPESVR